MKKYLDKMKNIIELSPALAVALAALLRFQLTTPVLNDIVWPEKPEIERSKPDSSTSERKGKNSDKKSEKLNETDVREPAKEEKPQESKDEGPKEEEEKEWEPEDPQETAVLVPNYRSARFLSGSTIRV